MFKRIDHVEIIPTDFNRAIDFYTAVLGFNVRDRRKVDAPPLEEVAYLVLGNTTVELMRVKDASVHYSNEWRTGYRMMALEVDDMDKAVEYLATKGVPITWGPVSLGSSIRAEIKDPDGLSIELRQW
jgi:glyoxylase I family protein